MSAPINDGGPAFPMRGMHVNFGDGWIPGQCGMSLRAWLAGQALAGMDHTDVGADDAALWAVEAVEKENDEMAAILREITDDEITALRSGQWQKIRDILKRRKARQS